MRRKENRHEDLVWSQGAFHKRQHMNQLVYEYKYNQMQAAASQRYNFVVCGGLISSVLSRTSDVFDGSDFEVVIKAAYLS